MKQISFSNYREFFNAEDRDELIQYFAVTGGVPKYIEAFNNETEIYEGIRKNILNKQSLLYEEPIFLLEKEVSEIGSYFSIIKTIALGNHKLGHISSVLGVPQTNLTKYLGTLVNLDLIERQVPITEPNPEKSKKGLYFIKDNFIEFWFKFVYPYRSYIEMDDTDYVMEYIKKHFIESHVSFVYEKVCMVTIWDLNKKNKLPFKLQKVGRWWNNSNEIDIIGLNEHGGDILFCECKYINREVDIDTFYNLMHKAKQVEWRKGNRKEHFAVFSKTGFTKELKKLAEKRNDLILLV